MHLPWWGSFFLFSIVHPIDQYFSNKGNHFFAFRIILYCFRTHISKKRKNSLNMFLKFWDKVKCSIIRKQEDYFAQWWLEMKHFHGHMCKSQSCRYNCRYSRRTIMKLYFEVLSLNREYKKLEIHGLKLQTGQVSAIAIFHDSNIWVSNTYGFSCWISIVWCDNEQITSLSCLLCKIEVKIPKPAWNN